MPTRDINLTPETDKFVDLITKIQSGQYANASEVLRARLRALEGDEREEQAKLEGLRAAVQAGEDSGIAEDGVSDRLLERIRQRSTCAWLAASCDGQHSHLIKKRLSPMKVEAYRTRFAGPSRCRPSSLQWPNGRAVGPPLRLQIERQLFTGCNCKVVVYYHEASPVPERIETYTIPPRLHRDATNRPDLSGRSGKTLHFSSQVRFRRGCRRR